MSLITLPQRILEISIYRPGDFTSEAVDVNVHVSDIQDVFIGHAMVRSLFRDQDFSDFHQYIRGLQKTSGALASDRVKTAHPGDKMKQAVSSYLEDNSKMAKPVNDR
jgi:hypothetical protein